MFKIDQFGKDSFNITLSVQAGQACWANRFISVYAPAPAEIEGIEGYGFPAVWFNKLAGLGPILTDLPFKAPVDTASWPVLGTVGKAFAEFLKAASKIVKKDSPRSYSTVLGIADEAVATDGFRLIYGNVGFTSKEPICIPAHAFKAILDTIKAVKNLEVRLSADATTLALLSDTVKVFIRLSTIKIPNYKGVLPTDEGIPVQSADIDAAKTDALLKKKALKPSEPLNLKLATSTFNGRFLLDMPTAESYVLHKSDILCGKGSINTVLVGIRVNDEKAA